MYPRDVKDLYLHRNEADNSMIFWQCENKQIAESSGIFYAIIEREWTLNLGQIRNVLVVTFNLF